ncbi:MAG: phosphatase PAP2 family protein [Candidatus Shapirobacteria bacterium]|jgi:membrane-associated phospholipid phosphatase
MNLLFWQTKANFYKLFSSSSVGNLFLVYSNYATWVFLLFPSFILVKSNPNLFWQLFFATIASEIIEKVLKKKNFWKRPAFTNNDNIPKGLIKSWYLTGSFPSGHTIKATFFLLLLIQHQLFFPVFLIIIIPLIFFRILIGFHYPIDVLGGVIIGAIIWFFVRLIIMPLFLINIVQTIFSFVFFIK